jgi:putative PIN family toxin of toxin-antitoxin system
VRVVVDPNVIISGLLAPAGTPARVLAAWQEGRFDLLVSPRLVAELERALAYPKLRRRLDADDADVAVRWISRDAMWIDDPATHGPIRSDDPNDDYLIAIAGQARAALVSGDRHLLRLADRIPVYTPAAFLASLR